MHILFISKELSSLCTFHSPKTPMKWLQKFLYKAVHEIIQVISASGPLHLLFSSKMLFPWAYIPCSFISLRSLLKQHLLWETFPCHSKKLPPTHTHSPTPIFNVLLFLLTFIISWQVSSCIYRHLSNYSLSKDCFCFHLKGCLPQNRTTYWMTKCMAPTRHREDSWPAHSCTKLVNFGTKLHCSFPLQCRLSKEHRVTTEGAW